MRGWPFARVKTYWVEMEATTIATQGSAVGRVVAEHYFEEVLEGYYVLVTCTPIVKTMFY